MICAGKTRYRSFAEAAVKAKRSGRKHDAPMAAYRCRECGGYHFGTPSRKIAPRGRKRAVDE